MGSGGTSYYMGTSGNPAEAELDSLTAEVQVRMYDADFEGGTVCDNTSKGPYPTTITCVSDIAVVVAAYVRVDDTTGSGATYSINIFAP